MSVNGFRIPLQEQKTEINTPLPLKMIGTQSTSTQRISTPPGSILTMKRRDVLGIDTPSKHYDNLDFGFNYNKSILLSPAFSSPQNHMKFGNQFDGGLSYNTIQPTEPVQYMKPSTYNSSPTANNSLSSFDEEFDQEKPRKKKKKDKKAFDILSNEKPPYSYATLIGMSILSHPEKRLTLSSIYAWISDTFKYYKKEDVGWQNSIRHNLSLNKAFIKGEKSKDGKGHFWCIEEGCEDQFLKLRNNKKSSYDEIMEQINQHNAAQASIGAAKSDDGSTQNSQFSTQSKSNKRTINSIPSSPNYYDSNERFNSINAAADYLKGSHGSGSHHDEFHQNKRQKSGNLGEPFGQNNWEQSLEHSKSGSQPYDLMKTPKLVISESPNKPLLAGKNLTFTSSFSCSSNLELSPIRPNDTGPLLEPLTPGKVYKAGAINHHLSNLHYSSNHLSPSITSENHHNQTPVVTSTSQSNSSSLNQVNSNSNQLAPSSTHTRTHSNGMALLKTPKANVMKTPLRVLKTPTTNLKKLWNSPGYLDDFYYSPLITSHSALHSYDDDDMILRAFESPANSSRRHQHAIIGTSKTLFADKN